MFTFLKIIIQGVDHHLNLFDSQFIYILYQKEHVNTNAVIQVTVRDLAITFSDQCSSVTSAFRVTGQCFMLPPSSI